eukprot:gene77-1189_t
MAASGRNAKKKRIMVMDVARAYFFAKATRELYVELPDGDPASTGDLPMCGRLNLSMYGTRDAARNWTDEYHSTLTSLGFIR